MNPFVKSGETAPFTGVYIEVGHGGGKVKESQRIDVQQGEKLPELKSYTVAISYKGKETTRDRQHQWLLIK